jgi:hypothetical protein
MPDTIVDQGVQRTLDWAREMRQWLTEYERHIKELVEEKKIPRPPNW